MVATLQCNTVFRTTAEIVLESFGGPFMKIFFIVLMFMSQIVHASPSKTDQQVPLSVKMELQEGLWAWRTVAQFNLNAADTNGNTVTLEFDNGRWNANFSFVGVLLESTSRVASWNFTMMRQDTANNRAISEVQTYRFGLRPNSPLVIVTSGSYQLQQYNIRVTLQL